MFKTEATGKTRFDQCKEIIAALNEYRAEYGHHAALARIDGWLDGLIAVRREIEGDRKTRSHLGRLTFRPDPYGQTDFSSAEIFPSGAAG